MAKILTIPEAVAQLPHPMNHACKMCNYLEFDTKKGDIPIHIKYEAPDGDESRMVGYFSDTLKLYFKVIGKGHVKYSNNSLCLDVSTIESALNFGCTHVCILDLYASCFPYRIEQFIRDPQSTVTYTDTALVNMISVPMVYTLPITDIRRFEIIDQGHLPQFSVPRSNYDCSRNYKVIALLMQDCYCQHDLARGIQPSTPPKPSEPEEQQLSFFE